MKKKYLLLLLSTAILMSCGTRKAAITNYKANVTTREEQALKIDSASSKKEEVKEKEITKVVDQKDIAEKEVKTEVKETFKDGELTERTTTTTVSDKVDKSKKEESKQRERQTATINDVTKNLTQTAKKVVDSLIKEKNKEVVSKKGIGLWWIPIVLLIAAFVWFWLRRKLHSKIELLNP